MRFQQPILLSDAAMGTALQSSTGVCDLGPWWSASMVETHPGDVSRVHDANIAAGSDVILTSTYQAYAMVPDAVVQSAHITEPHVLKNFKLPHLKQVCRDAMVLATTSSCKQSSSSPVSVAGSVGPMGSALPGGLEFTGAYAVDRCSVEIFYTPKLEALLDAGCSLIYFETFPRLDEAVLVVQLFSALCAARQAASTTCVVSFVTHDGFTLPCGDRVSSIVPSLTVFPIVRGIGFNCCYPPSAWMAARALLEIRQERIPDAPSHLCLLWKPNMSTAAMSAAPSVPSDITNNDATEHLRLQFQSTTTLLMEAVRANSAHNLSVSGQTTSADALPFLFDRALCGGCCGTSAEDIAWMFEARRHLALNQ